jgi:sarcosine oxidase
MNTQMADTIVVGGGVMGCAAAYHLAKDGQRVLLLEQFGIGHLNGSSHGPSRIIRLVYEGVDYVELARLAYQLWHELEAETGARLLQKMGGVDFGEPEALRGFRETLLAAAVPFEELSREELMRRFPQFRLPEGSVGFYQQEYSLLNADACVATMAAEARRHGAALHEHEAARRIRALGSDGGVEVTTDKGVYRAGQLVLAGGAWMRQLLRALDLELPLSARKEQLVYFRAADPKRYKPGRFPIFIHRFTGTTTLGSGFPIFGHEGVKLIVDRIGPEIDPDDSDRSLHQGNLERVKRYAAELLPELGEVIEAQTCLYTMTPDEDFIIDRHPAYPQVVIASPCSGHGFKFGVAIGRLLADLVQRGATKHDIARFRLDRPSLAVTNLA